MNDDAIPPKTMLSELISDAETVAVEIKATRFGSERREFLSVARRSGTTGKLIELQAFSKLGVLRIIDVVEKTRIEECGIAMHHAERRLFQAEAKRKEHHLRDVVERLDADKVIRIALACAGNGELRVSNAEPETFLLACAIMHERSGLNFPPNIMLGTPLEPHAEQNDPFNHDSHIRPLLDFCQPQAHKLFAEENWIGMREKALFSLMSGLRHRTGHEITAALDLIQVVAERNR